MVNVQVGADDEIDCLRRESGCHQVREERPIRRSPGFDDKGVKAHQELAVVINKVGHQPGLRATSSRVASTKKSTGKGMTCSTTCVIRTPSTSHDIVPTLLAGPVEAVQTDPAVLA